MKRKRETHTYNAKWTQFARCGSWTDADGKETKIPDDMIILRNNIFTVHIEGCDVPAPMGPVAWLSIKRNDRQTIHDWRELQRIKNMVMGEECEAVELYPAESRLHDSANQYHLFCFAPGYQLPFGYAGRLVSDGTADPKAPDRFAKQRPFSVDDRPADCINAADLPRLFGADPTLGAKLVHRRMKPG